METVAHLWNSTKFLAKINNSKVNEIRNNYIKSCRELGDDVDLPNQFFGYNTMCPHCGSLWNSINHTVRISKSKKTSASIQKLIKKSLKYNANLTTSQKKLIDKSKKHQTNKLIITCSCCLEKTKIQLNKVKKEKLKRQSLNSPANGITPKKKKKKKKDKTAGLLITTPKTPNKNFMDNSIKKLNMTPTASKKQENSKKLLSISALTISKKINALKLKGILNSTAAATEKTGLDSLLTEQ